MGLGERRGKKIPARKEREWLWREEAGWRLPNAAAHCALLKAPFHVVKGTAPPLAATQSYNVLHPWERYC